MNITNKQLGTDFENLTSKILTKEFQKNFLPQKALPIGAPPKLHKFDFVSYDNSIVCECKCLSWTKSGKIPSAKISVLNEAVFYLNFLPNNIKKYLIIKKSNRSKNQETLAQYYLRLYGHLLTNISIIELDIENLYIETLI